MRQKGFSSRSKHQGRKWSIIGATIMLLSVAIMSSILASTKSALQGSLPDQMPSCATTTRGVITIDGDGDFTGANGVVKGDGTPSNPYVISGWNIDAGENSHCISITNTQKCFIVVDCVLRDSDKSDYSAGLLITGALNATVIRNIISDCMYGIYFSTSANITILNNTCSTNRFAIYFNDCDRANVTQNFCSANFVAIYLSTCNRSVISSNVVEYYSGILYHGNPVLDINGSDNVFSNNTLTSVSGPMDIWIYILIAFVVAGLCGILLRNRIHKAKEQRMTTPAKWQPPWHAKLGVIIGEFVLILGLPLVFKIENITDTGTYTTGAIGVFYTIYPLPALSDYIITTNQGLSIIAISGLFVQLLLELVAYRKVHAAIKAGLPKQYQESWEIMELVRGVARFGWGGFVASLACAIIFGVACNLTTGIGIPAGTLFLLPAWFLYLQMHREGMAKFKAECVTLFKSNPERAFSTSLDQEFEAWASGSKDKGGKVEALPQEVVPKIAAPVRTPVKATLPTDRIPLLLEIILQLDLPNKTETVEMFKRSLITVFKLDIPSGDVDGMKGEELIARLQHLRNP